MSYLYKVFFLKVPPFSFVAPEIIEHNVPSIKEVFAKQKFE